MSDQRLRELERRWRETGAVEDEAAYLQERVRAGHRLDWPTYARLVAMSTEAAASYLAHRRDHGELDADMLDLARHCRHAPACAGVSQGQATSAHELVAWGEALVRWGHEPLLRSLLGVGWWLAARQGAEPQQRMRRLTEACEAWFARPTEETVLALERVESEVRSSNDDFSRVSEYLTSVDMGPHDPEGVMEFVVEGLCISGDTWGFEEVRVAAELEIVRWALRGAFTGALPPGLVPEAVRPQPAPNSASTARP